MNIDYLRSVLDYIDGKLYWKPDPRQRPQWNGIFAGKQAGCVDARGYRHISFQPNKYNGLVKPAYLLSHRIVFAVHRGYWPETVDHINRDTRDDRIENLRAAGWPEQCWNTGTPINSTTGHRGVSPKRGRFEVRIMKKGKRYHIGNFATVSEATAAWNTAADRLLGEWKPSI